MAYVFNLEPKTGSRYAEALHAEKQIYVIFLISLCDLF